MTTRLSDALRAKIDAAFPDLLDVVADGGHIGKACENAGLKREHIRIRMLEQPSMRAQWDLAREQSAESYFDQILDIIHNPGADREHTRVKVDALKWMAAKRNPRAYSDKHTLDVNVKTVDLTRIVQDANARLAQARARAIGHDVADAVIVQRALGVASTPASSEGE